MEHLRIILPVAFGLFVGIAFGWKGEWGIGTYQSYLFPVSYFLGLLIMACATK